MAFEEQRRWIQKSKRMHQCKGPGVLQRCCEGRKSQLMLSPAESCICILASIALELLFGALIPLPTFNNQTRPQCQTSFHSLDRKENCT